MSVLCNQRVSNHALQRHAQDFIPRMRMAYNFSPMYGSCEFSQTTYLPSYVSHRHHDHRLH
jgi:hypothetical protein